MLISPEGKVENSDAKQIISKWGIDGFPFRTSDHTRLTQQWNWFWNEMITLSPIIRELVSTKHYEVQTNDCPVCYLHNSWVIVFSLLDFSKESATVVLEPVKNIKISSNLC